MPSTNRREETARVVVPYAEFLERHERRLRVAADIALRNVQRTIDVQAVSVALAKPLSSEQKHQYQEGQGDSSST